MKKYVIKNVLFFFIFHQSYSQKDTTVLSREETIELMKMINIDTVKMLRDHGVKACACIDSISSILKDSKEKAAAISGCIDKETLLYQSLIEINRSMKNGNLNIALNLDKDSRKYKMYYYRIEEWLTDSCNSMKVLMNSNNKAASSFSYSTDMLALQHYNKGINLMNAEKYKEALPWFKKAVEADPEFAFAWDNVGLCSRRIGELDEALNAYKKSLEIDPKGKTPLQNIPVVYEFKEQYDKAIEAFNNLLKIFPGDAEGYYGIGRMYLLKNDPEKALDYMCKAYNLYVEINSPYRVDAQSVIGDIYKIMKGKGDEAKFYKILKDNKISTK